MRFNFYLFSYLIFCFLAPCKNTQAEQNSFVGGMKNYSFSKGFIENKGQIHDQNNHSNPSVLYLLNGSGMNVQLRKTGFSYDTYILDKKKKQSAVSGKFSQPEFDITYKFHRVDVEFNNANPDVLLQAEEVLPEFFNYFITNANEQKITNIHHYKTITYKNIYPKIDLIFTLNHEKPEYNFVIHPGGKTTDIQMEYKGMNNIQRKNKTELNIEVAQGSFIDAIPLSYEIESKKEIEVAYNLSGNKVTFTTKKYNNNNTLVIDPTPTLLWGTYFGSVSNDKSENIARDVSDGSLIITGETSSSTNLATTGAYQINYKAGLDAFVAKFSPDGKQLIWATYYGGTGDDVSINIAIDGNSNALITGYTLSNDLPVTLGAFRTSFAGKGSSFNPNYTGDAFVAKFSPDGKQLIWGTYYGGTKDDIGYGITIDGSNNVFVTGYSETDDNTANPAMTTPGVYQPTNNGGIMDQLGNAFVAKFNSATGTLAWGTFYGGTGVTEGFGIVLDGVGNPIITGFTSSPNCAVTAGAYQTANQGNAGCAPGSSKGNAFIAKISFDGTTLMTGTYYGGGVGQSCFTYGELAAAIATDAGGNIFITGFATDPDHIATAGSYQTTKSTSFDAFVAKFDPNAQLIWSSYYGGSGSDDEGSGIAVDGNDNVLITGLTNTTGTFPNGIATAGSYQNASAGGSYDAYVAKFSPDGKQLPWGTYYGGTGIDKAFGIVLDASGNPIVTGYTTSSSLISTPNAWQPVLNGAGTYDGFMAKFVMPCSLAVSPSSSICQGNSTTLTVNGGISYVWTPSVFLSSSMGVANTASPIVSTTYTVTEYNSCAGSATVTVTVIPDPTITVSSNQTICFGETVQLTASGAINFSWSPSNYLSSTSGTSVTSKPDNTISYLVIGTDPEGCSKDSSVTITVLSLPTIIPLANNYNICEGVTTTTVSVSGASIYVWSPPTGLNTSTGASIVANPLVTTSYTVQGTSANGCSSDTVITINVNATPTIAVSPDVSVCKGISVQLTAAGATTYQWNPATMPSTGSLVFALLNNNTTYTVTGNTGGCSSEAIVHVFIYQLPTVDAGTNANIVAGESYTIIATANQSGLSYSWIPSVISSNGPTAIVDPISITKYYVIATDLNGCESRDSITIFVTIKCGDIFIPNAFSPNGDGANDVLFIKAMNNSCIQSMSFEIYDRWGVKVFDTTDTAIGWDGKHKGKEMDPAVFVYNLQAILMDGSYITKKGNVSLIK